VESNDDGLQVARDNKLPKEVARKAIIGRVVVATRYCPVLAGTAYILDAGRTERCSGLAIQSAGVDNPKAASR
jgi:hypothetical protein